ncbi:hypothetical protein [Paenibacillus harenae]|uniref:hypothetical protein n=1 Tax=Paenibacillus harenae TaxID=306543 RepID=UPI00278DB2E0|nr:hypothetical protein [Paenibacillus harenae]MDQ0062359.1 hypothetical protein [Paenibacillus harenae]
MKQLTITDFVNGVEVITGGRITSVAPLGYSGNDLVLDGQRRNESGKRESLVSLRRYCDTAELLITDKEGRFLTYQKYHFVLGTPFIAHKFFEAWNELSDFIEKDMNEDVETVFAKDATWSVGFRILALANSATEATESA